MNLNPRILDKSGTWVQNRTEFRMADPENGVIYEPGLPMKVSDSQWRKDRSDVIADIADPFEKDAASAKPIRGETPLRESKK